MLEQFTIFNVVRLFIVASAAFVVALALEPFWMRTLKKHFSRGKQIEKSGAPIASALHKKKEGTPTMGGVIIWVTVTGLTALFFVLHLAVDGFWSKMNFLSRSQTWLPLAFLVVAALVGMADDLMGIFRRTGLAMKQRIALFIGLAAIGGWWFVFKLERDSVNIPFLGDVTIGPFYYFLLFVVVLVATAFSANETDGLDGLSGGVFLTIFGALAAIAFDQGRMDLAVFLSAIMGSLVAFLWFNIYPARFFMGDTGVMALGFVAGSTAMLLNVPFLMPILALVFVLESGSVIIQMTSKKLRHKKVFLSTPIHHHFEALGWHETQITMRFWMLNAFGAMLALIIFLVDSKIPPLTGEVFRELMQMLF